MQITFSDEIDLVSFTAEVPVEGMAQILETLLPEFNSVIDPTFIDPEVEYMGRIQGFNHEEIGPKENGFLDMCLSDLEMFSVESSRTEALVLLRKGDEMIILTEHNAEVIQEEDMSEMMRAVETSIAKQIEEAREAEDSGMFR